MSNKLCLIIDDKDQNRVFSSDIKTPLKTKGYYVDLIFINASAPEVLDDDQNIDLDKLSTQITKSIEGKHVDIIATDFDLSDENVNGVTVIEEIRKIRKQTPILLYSGKLENVVKEILGDYSIAKLADITKGIRKLMQLKIINCVDRNDYPNIINDFLKQKNLQTTALLLQKLREYSEMSFQSGYPPFNGRTIGSIADEIEQQTPQGRDFQEEIIEQVVAHLIEINN